ncbi:APC family permease [Nonomuraea sp. CA-143628]|uniref:APC family permease n=1 Tax=Nonomuraea sp. CA-143628 TaxID=3239997 RepID=UPI003D8A43B8
MNETSTGVSPGEDQRLRRGLGTISLSLITFSSVIGSGWLLAPYTAAKAAGPAAFLSWTIASVATALVSLAFIDLAFRHPMSGGNVRWPQLASGPLVGSVVGWAVFLQAVSAGPSESTAVVQYAAKWLPWVMSGESLSWAGRLIAAGLLVFFCTLNLFGIKLLAKVNNVVATIKVVIPALTVILLLASGFDTTNVATGGGIAPYGVSAALTAVVGGGLVYSFTGINAAAVMSGEAKDPRRTVPRATLIVLAGTVVLYMGLQAVMIFSLPSGLLGSGWQGINLNSPLASLATLLGLSWFATVLLADAIFSPSGSLLIGIGVKGRYTYGAAQNGLLPAALTKVDSRFGIPRRALLLNVGIGSVIVLTFGNWKSIASSLSFYYGLSYAAVSVAVTVLAATTPLEKGWLRRWAIPVGFASFVLSGLILYWSTWEKVRVAVPLLLIGFLIYLVRTKKMRVAGGWLVGFMLMLAVLSALGSFEGAGLIAAPYDSILVGVFSAGIWWLAHRSGLRHQRSLAEVATSQEVRSMA